uniref:Peptidase S1 domain-containing protein n=1 Tax=Hucho hucho TaxID=62062 RepID=A0A4W5N9Z4_9TELE
EKLYLRFRNAVQYIIHENTYTHLPLSSRTSWPWQVSVWLGSEGKDGHPICSGTLISPCWALASAHCFTRFGIDPSQYVVRVGGSDRALTLEEVVVHRKFRSDQGPGGHDLALLRVPSPKGHCLTFDPHTNAACLPTPDTAGGKTASSCIAAVTAGWDGPDAVLQSWVPLLSSWQCKKRYGDGYSSHGTLCAGSPPDTRRLHKNNGCQGNWGGGLVCQGDGGRWVLTGIVSGGYGCSDPSTPALYTRVGRFRRWIEEVTHTQQREQNTHSQEHEELTHTEERSILAYVYDELKHTHSQKQSTHTDDQFIHTQHNNIHTHDHNEHKHTHDLQSNTHNELKHTHNQHAHTHMHDKHTQTREAVTHTHALV